MTRRRVLLCAAASGVLAACAVPGATEGPATSSVVPSRLDFWPANEGKAVDVLLERFRANAPQITINREEGGNLTKVQTALAAGTPPDIAAAIIANLGDIASKDLSENLTQLLKGQRGWQPDGFLPGLKAVHGVKGELFAAPYVTNTTPIAINLDLMERANLKLPANTWTFDKLADYATKMTTRTGTSQYWGYGAPHVGEAAAVRRPDWIRSARDRGDHLSPECGDDADVCDGVRPVASHERDPVAVWRESRALFKGVVVGQSYARAAGDSSHEEIGATLRSFDGVGQHAPVWRERRIECPFL